ncbi:TIGR01666 family membrane protein [Eikenella sp. S3360]|uniref:TIGR01666 family membrane protein n=2 Tax=Eikenella glucosivorans TaxID=2766967 RepID=A0ABS0N782_9NEIS|nr:TIGR01666 family membrane protein [Eikenella glucosivorans]
MLATLPMLASVCTAVLAVWYWQRPLMCMPLVLGIIAGALVDLDNRLTGRIKNVLLTIAAFSVSSLAVQLTFGRPLLFLAAMTALTFVFTLSGAVSLRYRTISFGTLVVALYTILTIRHSIGWYANTLLILCGTLLYSGNTLLLHLILPHRPVQDSMAAAYSELAAYLDIKAQFFDPDDTENLEQRQIELAMQNGKVTAAFNQVRSALFYRMRGQHRHPRTTRMLHDYFAAQDIHERAAASYIGEYRRFVADLSHSDLIFRIQRLIEWQAQACRDTAQSLRQGGEPPTNAKLDKLMAGICRSLQHHQADPAASNPDLPRLLDNLGGINYQLTHLARIQDAGSASGNSEQTRIVREDQGGWRHILTTLHSHLNFDSAVFRHAVRLAIVVFVCIALIESLRLPMGYWILLTAVFVCQPNYSATKSRLAQRMAGTLAGVAAGSLLPYFTPSLPTQLAVVALSSTLFFFFRTNKYSYSTFFITIQALTNLYIAGLHGADALPWRLLDTLIGCGIAWWAVSMLWPDWHYLSLPHTAGQALASHAGYLKTIARQLQRGSRCDDAAYRIARRRAHESAAQLSSTLSDMSGQPKQYAASLPGGFTLLKTVYALSAYISALGAYRSHLSAEPADSAFLQAFGSAAEQSAHLLAQLPKLSCQDFQAAYANLQQQLDKLRPGNTADPHAHTLWQQLTLIAKLLPPAHQALHAVPSPSLPLPNPPSQTKAT